MTRLSYTRKLHHIDGRDPVRDTHVLDGVAACGSAGLNTPEGAALDPDPYI